MSESPLIVENLTFRYRDRETTAIRSLSFEAHVGEANLLLGPAAAAKPLLFVA